MAIATELPLGVCEVTFDATGNGASNPVHIDTTLRDEDTNFSSETSLFEVFVDQLDGAYMASHVAGDTPATFTCSVFVKPEDLPNLSATYEVADAGDTIVMGTVGKNVMYGTLVIHPLSMGNDKGADITGFKVSCNVTLDLNYKSEDLAKADLTFNFSSDQDSASPYYGKTFLIGDGGFTSAPAPIILKDLPADSSLAVGDTLELFLVVDNDTPVTGITWYKDDVELTGQEDLMLSIGSVAVEDAGAYYCVLTYRDQTTQSATCTVTVA